MKKFKPVSFTTTFLSRTGKKQVKVPFPCNASTNRDAAPASNVHDRFDDQEPTTSSAPDGLSAHKRRVINAETTGEIYKMIC